MRTFRPRTALTLVVASAGVIAVAACGSSSSGPKGPSAAQLAKSYDSLATVLFGNGTYSDTIRAEVIEILNGVNADGVAPTTISLTVGDPSTVSWFANFVDLVDSAGTDSIQIYTLWSSTSVAEANVSFFGNDTLGINQSIAAGGDLVDDSTSTVTSSNVGVSGSCSLTAVTNVYDEYPTYYPSAACSKNNGTLGGTVVNYSDTSSTAAIGTIVVPTTTIGGVRLQFPTSSFLRIKAVLQHYAASRKTGLGIARRR